MDNLNHDSSNNDILLQKLNELKTKKKSNINKFSVLNYNIYIVISILVASAVLGFVGGSLAVKNNTTQSSAQTVSSSKNTTESTHTTSSTATNSDTNHTIYLSISSIAEMNIKSIAEITTESVKTDKSLKQYTSSGAGSGIVVSSDGYILTNNHVISDANTINVAVDGEHFEASLVGTDSEFDIALLKIDKTDLHPVTFGDSNNVKIGENVVAIGNPLGQLGGTVTQGIISALNRDITINNETMNLLQTDAAVNPGNSGGGLFNLQGELIGMIIAKSKSASAEGIGFAIPVNNLQKPLNDLKEFGYIRGRVDIEMGITDASMLKSSNLYKNYSSGVFITNVPEESNAKAAGFQAGDCIVSINSDSVSNITSLNKILRNYTSGDTVSVGILRKEESLTLNLQFAEKK